MYILRKFYKYSYKSSKVIDIKSTKKTPEMYRYSVVKKRVFIIVCLKHVLNGFFRF